MEKIQHQATLLSLLEELSLRGSWCGETHIQKCAYFLQEGLGVPLGMNFVLYKHGPFSFGLREVLGELRGDYLIDVKPQPYPYGPSLVVTDAGRVFMRRCNESIKRYAWQTRFIADKLGRRPVVELERLGTALFVRQTEPRLDAQARADRMMQLKPHIKPLDARDAVEEVERLLKEAAAFTEKRESPPFDRAVAAEAPSNDSG
jgi:hypothetical protein